MPVHDFKNGVIIILATVGLLSCEEPDTIIPAVTIISPMEGAIVDDTVRISCMASDNIGINKIELWIDGEYSGNSDNSQPYYLEFFTSEYIPGSQHVIVARAYDTSGNIADSSPITLTVSPGFMKTYGSTLNEMAFSVKQTSDGGFILAGYTAALGDAHVFLLKTDVKGNIEWETAFGGSSIEIANSVCQTSDGGYVLTGSSSSSNYQLLLMKVDAEGNQIWSQRYGGNDFDEGNSVQQTSDGGYIIIGEADFNGHHYRGNAWLIKTDVNGIIEWDKKFGGSLNDTGNAVQQTIDGGYIIIGSTESNAVGGYRDAWLIKTNESGYEEWSKVFGDSNDDRGLAIAISQEGGYAITGHTLQQSDQQAWLVKVDVEGLLEWDVVISGGVYDMGRSINQTTDLGYIITGTTTASSISHQNLWLLKFSGNGSLLWDKIYGGDLNDDGYSVQQTGNGGYVVGGVTESYGNGMADVWLIKTDSQGITTHF